MLRIILCVFLAVATAISISNHSYDWTGLWLVLVIFAVTDKDLGQWFDGPGQKRGFTVWK